MTATATNLAFAVAVPDDLGLDVTPLEPFIGAEIGGVDLRKRMTPALRDAIRGLLLKHKVIFFRDQDITAEQQIAFGRNFGELEVHPFIRTEGEYPEIQPVYAQPLHGKPKPAGGYGRADHWHTDTSWRLTPSLGAILRAIDVPPVGGDTIWVNAVAAYELLPQDVKDRIGNLCAIHDAGELKALSSPGKAAEVRRNNPIVAHPVVRTHPETGERALYLNDMLTTQIIGLETKAESDELIQFLLRQFLRPEIQVRFKWRKHSIAFWDNRCTVHYAVNDYGDYPRRMERVAIVGDRPFH
jgi:taurine dioxygenase